MLSSAKIIKELEYPSSPAMDLALVVPAVTTSLQTLENAYTVVNAYSPDMAENIPLGAHAGFWRKIALGLLPVFLAFGWVAFFKSVRHLSEAPERSWDLWLKTGIHLVAATGATLVTVFLFTGLAYLVPYILAVVLGLNVLQGFYYAVKQCYLAYKNPNQRWQHLQEAGKHVLGIAINTLAIVLNVLVFQTAQLVANGIRDFASDILSIFLHFQDLINLINGPVMAGVTLIQGVSLGWVASLTLLLVVSASKLNKQSYQLLAGIPCEEPTYEGEAFQDVGRIIEIISDKKEHPLKRAFFTLSAPIVLPLYALTALIHFVIIRPVAAVIVGIPELMLRGLYCCGKRWCSSTGAKPQKLEGQELVSAPIDMTRVPALLEHSPTRVSEPLDPVAVEKAKKNLNYSPVHSQFKPLAAPPPTEIQATHLTQSPKGIPRMQMASSWSSCF